MNVMQAIAQRQSCRNFTDEPVTKEQIATLLQAANAAPVGRAKYDTVHLTVITDPQLIAEIDRTAAEVNGNPGGHPLYGAGTLLLVSTPLPEEQLLTGCNVGCVMENMTLAAVELGLSSVYIFGAFRAIRSCTQLVKKLKLPEGFTAVSALAVGHAAAPEQPRDLAQEKINITYLD